AKVAVVAAPLPSGINSYLIAVQFNTGQALASNQMTIATASAVLTTSFWLTVALHVFG
ncbi:MAG: AEC family transporter, partial [Mesorhizobium sp.]